MYIWGYRNDGVEDQYSILIRFDNQESTDSFYRHFNKKHFSSLEVCSSCSVFYSFSSGMACKLPLKKKSMGEVIFDSFN